VTGIDPAGNEVIYKLESNLSEQASYEFDEVVKGLVIKSSDLEATILQSHMATQLLAVAQSRGVRQILNSPQSDSD
jgi:hypothetical protein